MSPVRRPKPYWWFQGASVRTLTDQLNAAGPDARVEVRIGEEQHMTFTVIPAGLTAQRHAPINDSHVCPPNCPE